MKALGQEGRSAGVAALTALARISQQAEVGFRGLLPINAHRATDRLKDRHSRRDADLSFPIKSKPSPICRGPGMSQENGTGSCGPGRISPLLLRISLPGQFAPKNITTIGAKLPAVVWIVRRKPSLYSWRPIPMAVDQRLFRQTNLLPQCLQPRVAIQKGEIRRIQEIPSDARRPHRNHLIQDFECPVLIAKRGKDLRFT